MPQTVFVWRNTPGILNTISHCSRARQMTTAHHSQALLAPTVACLDPAEVEQQLEHLEAARAALEAAAARAAATQAAAAARAAAAREQLQAACDDADAQHDGVAIALAEIAHRLDALEFRGGSGPHASSGQHPPAPPLLGANLPDAYARACTTLLNTLSSYVQHHNGSSGTDGSSSSGSGEGGLAAAQAHQRRQRELLQLQGCLCKAERLRVEEEAEMARCGCSVMGNRPESSRSAGCCLAHCNPHEPCTLSATHPPTLALEHTSSAGCRPSWRCCARRMPPPLPA